MKKIEKAQVWSMDAIIAVVVIVIAVIGFIVFSSDTVEQRKGKSLAEESSTLARTISTEPAGTNLSIAAGSLDERRIVRLSRMDYFQAKQELGLTSDFCIYFTDRAGNLVDVGGVRFLGSPYINVSVGGLRYTCNGTLLSTTVCNDGFDNDGDGLVDYPDDPGCKAPDDPSE